MAERHEACLTARKDLTAVTKVRGLKNSFTCREFAEKRVFPGLPEATGRGKATAANRIIEKIPGDLSNLSG